ncbi:MAG: hypothetical protein DMG96_41450, partial [Acidobacteria bacterium]
MKVQRYLDGARVRYELELVTRHGAHGFFQEIHGTLQTRGTVERGEAASEQLADGARERHAGYLVALTVLQNENP